MIPLTRTILRKPRISLLVVVAAFTCICTHPFLARFDPASLEILRQLGQIIDSQDHVLQTVRSVAASQAQCLSSGLSPPGPTHVHAHVQGVGNNPRWDGTGRLPAHQQVPYVAHDWTGEAGSGGAQTDSTSTTPAASTSVAAVRWFGLVANDASREALQAADAPLGVEGGFLDPSDGQDEDKMTPLQRATRMIDGQPPERERDLFDNARTPANSAMDSADFKEQSLWQAADKIWLLDREQILFENFLHRICPWVGLITSNASSM